jgi:hypothetical protein
MAIATGTRVLVNVADLDGELGTVTRAYTEDGVSMLTVETDEPDGWWDGIIDVEEQDVVVVW